MAWRRFVTREEGSDMFSDMFIEEAYFALGTGGDEEEQRQRGSVPGRATVPRDRHTGFHKLMQDYFVDRPVYDEQFFRRRFRMLRSMFHEICDAVTAANPYFQRRFNAAGNPGFHPLQKVTAAVLMLAYGGPADHVDDDVRTGESTVLETLNELTRTVVRLYRSMYLRKPNSDDITRLLQVAEHRGFPGMLGSIDCMHREWEKCPTALHGQHRDHFKKPTVTLEAVASYDLWIWHAFFGMPGSLNDIFDSLSRGTAPQVNFEVNGRPYNMGYYLADGIYPPWATLISGIPSPQSNKQRYFTQKQSEYRTDVECAFGVLQAKYAIIKGPARIWSQEDMKFIVDCVIILHNMGFYYERDMEVFSIEDYEDASWPTLDLNKNVPEVQQLIERHRRIQSRQGNEQLKSDLVEHVWNKFGGGSLALGKIEAADDVCVSLTRIDIFVLCQDLPGIHCVDLFSGIHRGQKLIYVEFQFMVQYIRTAEAAFDAKGTDHSSEAPKALLNV